MMAGKQRFSAAEVCEACVDSAGILAVVAKNLGCCRRTVWLYKKRYATVREALRQADEAATDNAESESVSLIDAGYWPAIKYRLGTKGKDRGYVERVEQEHRGSKDAPLMVEYVNDWRPSNPPLPAQGPADGKASSEAVQLAGGGEAVAEDDPGDGDSG